MKNITDEQLKRCNDCGKRKGYDQFIKRKNKNNTGVEYYNPFCKECMVKRATKWRKKNREDFNKYQREYHAKKRAKEREGNI